MNEQYVTSTHISKLGHNLLEVRERALKNLLSKLNIGLPFDNAFARNKEILTKCFEWFAFDDRSSEEIVLELIKRTVKGDVGTLLVKHFGSNQIINKLGNVRLHVNSQHIPAVDDIISYLKNTKAPIVPPLVSEVPLSYRSGIENIIGVPVESTATPIDGYVHTATDNEQKSGLPQDITKNSSPTFSSPCDGKWDNTENSALLYYTFCWQPLVTTDRHVLESVETSLRNPEQPSVLINTCHFFMDVLLRDFPPEIFLQRPTILKELERHFLGSTSFKVKVTIANCFLKFTESLRHRISCYSDPAVHNLKQYKQVFLQRYEHINSPVLRYNKEGLIDMRCLEIPTPVYCLQTLLWCLEQFLLIAHLEIDREANVKQLHIYLVLLRLIDKLVNVIGCTLNKQIWVKEANNPNDHLVKLTCDTLDKFAEVICSMFWNVVSYDFSSILYLIYMSLVISFLNILKQLIPCDVTHISLSTPIKRVLSIITSDMTIMFFYPKVHVTFLEYAKNLDHTFNCFSKCLELQCIYDNMQIAANILKSSDTQIHDRLILEIKNSLKCLKFHKNLSIIDRFFDVCCSSNISKDMQDDIIDVLLNLLSNEDIDIKSKIYCLCQEKIAFVMGPSKHALISTNTNINFLLNRTFLTEIILNGLSSEYAQVQQNSEDILLIMLKSVSVLSENVWRKVVELILLTFPAFACFADMTTPLGQTIINIIDPDRAQTIGITLTAVFKGNLTLLFCPIAEVRNEAFSRLCWLLSLQQDHKNLLPRLSTFNRSFSNLCSPKFCVDMNRHRETQNYYQSCDVRKILELLEGHNVEPVIRRSALTQLSVITEDHSLHNIFLESNGIAKIVSILQNALTETCFEDYPDSAIPSITILKNLALHSSSVRQRLNTDNELLHFLLRAMLLYCTDERLITDGSTLLFLLLFNDFLKGSPVQSSLSLPPTILKNMRVPFICAEFKDNSQGCTDISLDDKQSSFFLKLMWNLAWCDSQKELTSWKEPKQHNNVNNALNLTRSELLRIQNTCLEYSMRQCFERIQNYVSTEVTIDAIIKLSGGAHLYTMLCTDYSPEFDLLALPWNTSFEKFLNIPPSNDQEVLLLHVFECLKLVVPIFKMFGVRCWIADAIGYSDNPLLFLLNQKNNQNEDKKRLRQELFSLITVSIHSEQHYLEFYKDTSSKVFLFPNVVEIIAESLKQDAQGFYNLAMLDSMLSCLVNITANLGWSHSDTSELNFNKHILLQLTCSLCELIGNFHCGKGQSASESVMGLTISRNAILALNHLLMEMHHWNVDNWDTCFTEEGSGIDCNLTNLFLLNTSRDVVVRASIFQLFTGLFLSIDCIVELTEGIRKKNYGDLHELLVGIILDEDEASLVKEHAANAFCNYLATLHKFKVGNLDDIFTIMNHHNFYDKMSAAMLSLYLSDKFYMDNERYFNFYSAMSTISESENSTGSCVNRLNETTDEIVMLITPGCMKSFTSLLLCLLQVLPDKMITCFSEHHMVKRLIRLLSVPNIKMSTTRDVALYCDIMEMNIAICTLAMEVLGKDDHLNSVINSDECIASVVSLLNINHFCTKLSQLLYLRNKLWSKIFRLLATLFYYQHKREQFHRIFDGLVSTKISEDYIHSLCESISSIEFQDLQESALKNLTSILAFHDESLPSQSSIQTLFDEIHTPRIEVSKSLEDINNDLFTTEVLIESDGLPKAGAEICKLLLHLLQITTIDMNKSYSKRKNFIIDTLAAIVSISLEAKQYALDHGGLLFAMKQLNELHLMLSLQPTESLRKIDSKKRLAPLLTELGSLVQFLNNLAVSCEKVKIQLTNLGLSDLLHKHWNWICAIPNLLLDTLKMLCTFTSNCPVACDSLCLTNGIAGSRGKKNITTNSLVNAVIDIILREMDLISKTHDLAILNFCFQLLQNCCCSTECRTTIVKTNLLRCTTKLHPYLTKRQQSWEQVQLLWLEFLKCCTSYPEGQIIVIKFPELLQIFLLLTDNGTKESKLAAMSILRNISFSAANRPRLLACDEYLQMLGEKLTSGNREEQLMVVSIMWSLGANNQKGKLILKCAGLDTKLCNILQASRLSSDYKLFDENELQKMHYVLQLLRGNDR